MAVVTASFALINLCDNYDQQVVTERLILPTCINQVNITTRWKQLGFDYPIARGMSQELPKISAFAVFCPPPSFRIEKHSTSSPQAQYERDFKILNDKDETVATVFIKFYLGFELKVTFMDSDGVTSHFENKSLSFNQTT